MARQSDEKNASSSSISSSSRSNNEDLPSNDLLSPLCKRVYTDAVITPFYNLSFSDACIRTVLIESPDHECSPCHSQHVAIDQINPNLYLRNYIQRWQKRQNRSFYSYLLIPQPNVGSRF